MAIPNLSNSMTVAQLRHIQAIHEPPERRNPDTLVRHFLTLRSRLRTNWLGREALSKLQQDPFYYYLVARTRYYDKVVLDAVSSGVRRIVGVGCGTDTRAYRFRELLCSNGVKVLECDQADAIHAKQRVVRRWPESDHVKHMPIDLNEGAWPDLEAWLGARTEPKTLVMMEGVSPYVNTPAFTQFLSMLAAKLPASSLVAYDFKLVGVQDDFGRNGRTLIPFRLPAEADQVAGFHQTCGLHMEHMELSSELCGRLLPDLDRTAPRFEQDGLVRLRISAD
jgi:methyltransferase (TIGR00027 family)